MSFNPLHSGAKFYKQVMSIKTKKFKKRAKGKGKGKSAEKDAPSILDKKILGIIASAESDFFSNHKHQVQYFKKKLKGLSKDKLMKLKRKFEEILEATFSQATEKQKIQKFSSLSQSFIQSKIEESEKYLLQLKGEILQKLKLMESVHLHRNGCNARIIHYEDQKIPIKKFSALHFGDIVERFEAAVFADIVIADSRFPEGTHFVSHILTEALEILEDL